MFIMRTTHSYLFERVLRSFSHECRVLQEHYLKMHDYPKSSELSMHTAEASMNPCGSTFMQQKRVASLPLYTAGEG